MKSDEIVLLVCSPEDAEYLKGQSPDIEDSLVVTRVLEPGRLIMIPKQEFIDYLEEKGKFDGKTER